MRKDLEFAIREDYVGKIFSIINQILKINAEIIEHQAYFKQTVNWLREKELDSILRNNPEDEEFNHFMFEEDNMSIDQLESDKKYAIEEIEILNKSRQQLIDLQNDMIKHLIAGNFEEEKDRMLKILDSLPANIKKSEEKIQTVDELIKTLEESGFELIQFDKETMDYELPEDDPEGKRPDNPYE